jgi:hypothetical protein
MAKRTMFILAVLIALMSFTMSWSAETPEERALREEYSQVYQQISVLGKAGEKDKIVVLTEEIHRTWPGKDKDYYGRLISLACGELLNRCAKDGTPYKEIRQIAKQALDTCDPNRRDNMSITTEYKLVDWFQGSPTYSKGEMNDEQWAADRRSKTIRWLTTWQRMEKAIDKKYDPNDPNNRPVANVVPPLETHKPAGIAPDAIKDPVLRAQYVKAIEANKQNIKRYNEQQELKSLKWQFTRSLLEYFGQAYSIQPHNDEEVTELLGKYIEDPKVVSQIRRIVADRKTQKN